MRFTKNERRKHSRKSFINKVEFLIPFDTQKDVDRRVELALSMDVGRDGLSLYTDTPIRKKQNINITKASQTEMRKQAVVRWVRKFDNGLYKAGLMFIK